MELVPLEPDHLADLMRLKEAANWNQTEEDWLRCLSLQPDGCLGIWSEGQIVASATTISYKTDLSWIGMVLTLPAYRGLGLARKLMEQVISRSKSQIIRLDASDMGKSLYASQGFVDECPIERWVRSPEPLTGTELPSARASLAVDHEVFGADRSALLNHFLAYESAERGRSYSFSRPGSNWYYFGPWVADNRADAEALLRWFLGRHGEVPVCMDIFPHHKEAVTLAATYGFKPVRRLTRMVLNPVEPRLPDSRIYGIAGFEFG